MIVHCKSRVDSTRSASDARAGAVPWYTSDAEKEGALDVILHLPVTCMSCGHTANMNGHATAKKSSFQDRGDSKGDSADGNQLTIAMIVHY